MIIIDFKREHIEEASLLARDNYNEERIQVTCLPEVSRIPSLQSFADNGLGVAVFENRKMTGFLCCCSPFENAFHTAAVGTFSPLHAHGAVKENRAFLYRQMYQKAAEKWVEHKIVSHAVSLYAHDRDGIEAFFTCGFGLRCVDAVRPMKPLSFTAPSSLTALAGIHYGELGKGHQYKIRELRRLLIEHMGKSPCFMYQSPEEIDQRLTRVENGNSRIFAALYGGSAIACLELSDSAETFVSETGGIRNICGAYCLPQYRGKGIYQGLLNHVIETLEAEGWTHLGVDYESINSTAAHFWPKYFEPYTSGVVRRIDECALGAIS